MTTVQAAAARRVTYLTEVLIPRLQRLGLMSERVESRYRAIGLVGEP